MTTAAIKALPEKEYKRHHLTFKLALLVCLLGFNLGYSQETASREKNILGRWVAYSENREDTIVYISFNSPLTRDLPLFIQYGGITFKPGNVCLHHRWKRCGNDTGPDYDAGTWRLQRSKDDLILAITSGSGQVKNYVIKELTESYMVLVPTP